MLETKANLIRRHIIKMTFTAQSGHPGGSLSYTDVITALFFKVMRHRPEDPQWEDRDKFVLSKGHAAPAYYSALAESGYFPVEDLLTIRKLGSHLQGHPCSVKTPGVEMSTGSLGQGLSVANGMALAAKLDRKLTRIYCLMGDGELQEGQNWEAAMLASHYKLDNLTAFVDRNKMQIDGPTEQVMSLEPLADKWRAFGWNVIEINGHDMRQILEACEKAKQTTGKPTVIICHTTKGKGVSFMEGAVAFHGKAPNQDEYRIALKELGENI
jgi:transketolase